MSEHTVIDKRHHQVAEDAIKVETTVAPQAETEAPAEDMLKISLSDLSFGLVIGHNKTKGDLVFDVVGNPNLAEILGMGVLMQDRVDSIKNQYTASESRHRDQQFMMLNHTLGKMMVEISTLKQMLQGKQP